MPDLHIHAQNRDGTWNKDHPVFREMQELRSRMLKLRELRWKIKYMVLDHPETDVFSQRGM